VNADTPLKDIALAHPAAARVLERLHLDYCCGGRQSLKDACRSAGLETGQVIAELDRVCAQADSLPRWEQASAEVLIRHIVETHHAYTRTELPRIEALLAKVAARHGDAHGELHELVEAYSSLQEDLMPHLFKEEQILFPYIEALSRHRELGTPLPPACFGSVDNPLRQMRHEHEVAGNLLKRIRAVCADFAPPADACTSYRALFQALEGLEKDLMRHIHLENNLLFPRARALAGLD
jgi:regulator of cell morphogenesis and NO signaling